MDYFSVELRAHIIEATLRLKEMSCKNVAKLFCWFHVNYMGVSKV